MYIPLRRGRGVRGRARGKGGDARQDGCGRRERLRGGAEKGAARGASVFDKRRRLIGGRDAPLVLVVAPHPLGRGALERDRLVGLRGHRERMRGGARAAWPAIRAPSNNSRRTEPSTKRLRSRQRSPTPIFVVVARRFGLTGFADGLTVAKVMREAGNRAGGGPAASSSPERQLSAPARGARRSRPPHTPRDARGAVWAFHDVASTRRAAALVPLRGARLPGPRRRGAVGARRGGARGRASLDPAAPRRSPVDLPRPRASTLRREVGRGRG